MKDTIKMETLTVKTNNREIKRNVNNCNGVITLHIFSKS